VYVFFIYWGIFSVARTAGLIFIILDVLKPLQHKRLIEYEMEGFGIRLNKKAPNIFFKKKDKGGINLTATVSYTLYYFSLWHVLINEIILRYDSCVVCELICQKNTQNNLKVIFGISVSTVLAKNNDAVTWPVMLCRIMSIST
jgi:hypothetical protein